MKAFRTVLPYLAVAALLGAYIWFFERKPAEDASEKKEKIMTFAAGDVTGVVLENRVASDPSHRKPVRLVKDEKDRWSIVQPAAYDADQNSSRNLLTSATDMAIETRIQHPPDLAEFGLSKPSALAVFELPGGKAATLFVGDKSVNNQSYYVKAHDQADVFLVSASSVESIVRRAQELRNKVLYATGYAEARKVSLQRAGLDPVLLEKRGDSWSLRTPSGAWVPADEDETRQILNVVNGIRIQEFFDEPDLASMGLGSRNRGVIEIWPEEKAPSVSIVIGDAIPKKSQLYARRKDQSFAVSLPDVFDRDTRKTWSDFRDRNAMRFTASEAAKLSIGRRGTNYEYTKSPDGVWLCPGREQANDEAMRIVESLATLRVQSFAEKETPASAGVDKPLITARVTLKDGKVRQYRFGKRVEDKVYLASDLNRDIYLVFPAAANHIENTLGAAVPPAR